MEVFSEGEGKGCSFLYRIPMSRNTDVFNSHEAAATAARVVTAAAAATAAAALAASAAIAAAAAVEAAAVAAAVALAASSPLITVARMDANGRPLNVRLQRVASTTTPTTPTSTIRGKGTSTTISSSRESQSLERKGVSIIDGPSPVLSVINESSNKSDFSSVAAAAAAATGATMSIPVQNAVKTGVEISDNPESSKPSSNDDLIPPVSARSKQDSVRSKQDSIRSKQDSIRSKQDSLRSKVMQTIYIPLINASY